jgi:beta-phosphoglucomutase-like phosphatase (HAD superfamily)
MEKCGTKPWETIVVENAPLGVQAGVASRAFTIAVNTGPLPDEKLLERGADLLVPSLVALNRVAANCHSSLLTLNS